MRTRCNNRCMVIQADLGDTGHPFGGRRTDGLPYDAGLMHTAADLVPRGMLVFDADARVLACNRTARLTLGALPCLGLVPLVGMRGGPAMRLVASDAALQVDIEQAVSECAAFGDPANVVAPRIEPAPRQARTLLRFDDGLPRLVLHVARLARTAPGAANAALTPAVIGTLIDRTQVLRLDAQRLAELFDLSASSARVAEVYLRVDSVKDASRMLGISTNTVKTHLAAVYEKTGCSRQSQLVRLLMTLADSEPR
jgi:DNA-binding CsgD family transcriptional regulator